MKKFDLVRRELLRRKINEHFLSHPQSSVAVFKMDIGNRKTLWRVVREDKDYRITEIHTKKESFLIEAGTAGMSPSDSRFKHDNTDDDIGGDVKALRPLPRPKNPTKRSPETMAQQKRRKDQATRIMGGDPSSVGAMSLDKTAAPASATAAGRPGARTGPQKPLPPKLRQDPSLAKALGQSQDFGQTSKWDPRNMGGEFGKALASTKSTIGATEKMPDVEFTRLFKPFGLQNKRQIPQNIDKFRKAMDFYGSHNPELKQYGESLLREAEEDKKKDDEKPRDKKKPEAKPETDNQNQAQQGEPEAQAGIETNPQPTDDGSSQETPLDRMKPEATVGQELSGKSLGSVSFSVDPGSSKLTMEILGNANPSVLEYRRDGTVVWQHRGQTKVFRPSGGSSDGNQKI